MMPAIIQTVVQTMLDVHCERRGCVIIPHNVVVISAALVMPAIKINHALAEDRLIKSAAGVGRREREGGSREFKSRADDLGQALVKLFKVILRYIATSLRMMVPPPLKSDLGTTLTGRS